MFSLSTACAFSDEHTEETAEAAGRYFAELNRAQRRMTQGDEEKGGNGASKHRRPRKSHQRSPQKSPESPTMNSSSPDRINRGSSSIALLGENKRQRNEEDELDEFEGERGANSCNSLLLTSRSIQSAPNHETAGASFEDPARFFYNGNLPAADGTAKGSLSDAATCGENLGVISGLRQNRSMLLDLENSEPKQNPNTVTTNASNGGPNELDHSSNQTQTPTTPSFDIVTLNVSGLRFQTYVSTLERFPKTLLGDSMKRASYFNAKIGEYFFDRHRASFEAIVYFYQSDGKKLCRPENVPPDIFLKELQFFEMGPKAIDDFLRSQGCVRPKELVLPKKETQRRVWLLMEHPDSSLLARVLAFFSVFVIVLSTLSFCLETIPELKYQPQHNVSAQNGSAEHGGGEQSESFDNPFFLIELSCMCWFTLEFTLRFASCPSKWEFCKSFLNVIDFVAIVPFFVNLAWASSHGAGGSTPPFAVLRIFRLVRVFRIFKLSRHSRGLQILGKTFTASVQELCLLIFFLVLGLVLFSSAVYIAESGYESGFDSIPASFWYVIVTMTTVGYGDLTPKGPMGKLVGGMCAIVGVLVLALPVPVIVANFKHYYRQEARLARMRAAQNEGMSDDEMCDDDDSRSS